MNQPIQERRGKSQSHQTTPMGQLGEILSLFRRYWWVWLSPTVGCSILALGYAMTRPDSWVASQELWIRDEAMGSLARPGQFDDSDARKTAQETVLEVARSHQVLAHALKAIGPAGKQRSTNFPTESDIADLRDEINVAAPRGAELGKTEVIYLTTTANDPARAIQLTAEVCRQMLARLKHLRDVKARGIIAELTKTRDLARDDLDAATGRLAQLEKQVGSDLGELRSLNDAGAGDSNLLRSLNQIKLELRQAQNQQEADLQLQEYLNAARGRTEKLVATPNRLLESQPALRRLKDGLLDAQLRTSELLGTMNEAHPQVQVALASENEIRSELKDELAIAVRGLKTDMAVNQSQMEALQQQHDETTRRLDELAGLRAKYGNLVAEVSQRTEVLNSAERELAAARASKAAAELASVVTPVDAPRTGARPQGPGKTTITVGGMAAGLLLGVGLVLLLVPTQGQGRRWSDYIQFGRRASDIDRRAGSRSPVPSQAGAPAAETEPTAQFERRNRPPAVSLPATSTSSAAPNSTAPSTTETDNPLSMAQSLQRLSR